MEAFLLLQCIELKDNSERSLRTTVVGNRSRQYFTESANEPH